MAVSNPSPVDSPCVRVCALNAEGFCTGCFRSKDEITAWTRMTPDQQQLVVDLCRERAVDGIGQD